MADEEYPECPDCGERHRPPSEVEQKLRALEEGVCAEINGKPMNEVLFFLSNICMRALIYCPVEIQAHFIRTLGGALVKAQQNADDETEKKTYFVFPGDDHTVH